MGPVDGGEENRESMFLPGMEEISRREPTNGTRYRADSDEPVAERNGPFDDSKPSDTQEKRASSSQPMSADGNQVNMSNAGVPQVPVSPSGLTSEQQPFSKNTPPPEYIEPLWMRRTKLVIFVMACIYLGIILIILPWNEVWIQNALIHRYPALRDIALSYFTRGAITGLGFVNVWLGVWEAVHYREKK